ncbi:MAG: hypothetical protein IGS54_17610 [Elainella sp. C42_A2020_010]|nr:hypothetical protein [Elainella sp. C42_A2020_010]
MKESAKGEPDLLTYCDWLVGAKHSGDNPLINLDISDPNALPLRGACKHEVADFDDEQIRTFAQKWFGGKGDADRAKLFVEQL